MSIKHLYPTSTPALNLNPKSSRVADPRLSCVRNSIGTYVDPVSGLVKTAPVNVARVDKNGLLVEESRTNSITNSAVFSSGYAVSNFAATDNVATAPDGTTTAASLMETGGSGFHNFSRAEITSGAAGDYAQSIFVKDNGRAYVNLRLISISVGNCWHTVTFALIGDGTITQEQSGSGANFTNISRSIEHIGNGWYRITLEASNPNDRIYPWALDGSDGPTPTLFSLYGVASYTGDVTKGYYIWGAQVETGTFATSYIPTSGSTVQRLADEITLTNSGIFNPNEFTTINEPFGVVGGSDTLTVVGDGSKAERTFVYNSHLSQAQINASVGKTDEFWRWRILGSSFGLPNFTTDGQVTVDWGDGTVETLTTSDHTFTDGGGYHEVGFRLDSGTYFRPYINNNASHATKVRAFGPAPESMKLNGERAFRGCTNLESFDATIAGSGNSFYLAWLDCSSLTSFPLIDTSSAYNFNNTWQNCTSLTSFPLLDMSSATWISAAWYNCSSLTSFPAIDTSNVTLWQHAWQGCTGLTSFPLLDTSSGINFLSSWRDCSGLVSFPANFFDSWAGTPANQCFAATWQGCTSLSATSVENILNSIDASGQSAPASGKDIRIDYDTGTGTPNITTAVTNLKNRNWTITLNGVLQ